MHLHNSLACNNIAQKGLVAASLVLSNIVLHSTVNQPSDTSEACAWLCVKVLKYTLLIHVKFSLLCCSKGLAALLHFSLLFSYPRRSAYWCWWHTFSFGFFATASITSINQLSDEWETDQEHLPHHKPS